MTITPSNLYFITLIILALPAILCLLLMLWGIVFKSYSDFFVQDPLLKQKLEKFITPNYEDSNDEFDEFQDDFQLDYISIGFVGFISFSLLWIIYTPVTYFFLPYFTDSYSGIFFTHATSIISIFFLLFCWIAIVAIYHIFLELKCVLKEFIRKLSYFLQDQKFHWKYYKWKLKYFCKKHILFYI